MVANMLDNKKSSTCEEGGDTLQNFCWVFIDELEKQVFIKKCWNGPIKNVRLLIFTMLYLKKKKKKNTWRYYFTQAYQTCWWYDLQFLRYRVWQTKIGNYGSFFALYTPAPPTPPPPPLKTGKIRILKKRKKLLQISSFYTWVPKPTIIWGTVPQQAEFFVILGHFFSFTPITTHKIEILKIWKMHLEMSSFYTCVTKITIIWCMLPEIWSATDIIFCHSWPFFALLPH